MATRRMKSTAKTTIKDGITGAVDGGAGGVGFGISDDYSGKPALTGDTPEINENGVIKSEEIENEASSGGSNEEAPQELLTNLPPISAAPMTEAPFYSYNVTPIDNDGNVTLGIEADGVNTIEIDSDAAVEAVDNSVDNSIDKAIRTAFYEQYSQLPVDNAIRQRAEKVDITLANTIQQCETCKQRIEEQKELAAKTLETVKYVIGEIIRVKNEEPTFEKLEKVYSQWIIPLSKLYDQSNFKFDDVCPFVANALNKLHDIPQDSTTIPVALDEIVGILDESMTHLIKVQDEGYGETLLDYYNCLSQQDAITGEAERMAKDVSKALKTSGKNTFSMALNTGFNATPTATRTIDESTNTITTTATTNTKATEIMANGERQRSSTKQTYRLLENLQREKAEKDMSGVPEDVPNYRLAIDASPRVCGNCRFFTGSEGVSGDCSAFNFTAKANYVCDAWQSPNLTSDHTTVRSIIARRSTGATAKADGSGKTVDENIQQINSLLEAGTYPMAAGLLADMSTDIYNENPKASRQVMRIFDDAYHALSDAYQKDDDQNTRGTWSTFERVWQSAQNMWNKEASKTVKTNEKSPLEYVDTNPVSRQGIVIQQDIDDEVITDLVYPLEVDRSYNEAEPPAPNAAVRTSFLPGDTIYSKSLNSMGVVEGSVIQDGVKMYSIKLLNSQGMASGSGYTYANDLVARSSQAMKRDAAGMGTTAKSVQSKASVKSAASRAIKSDDAELDQMIEVTRSIYKALKAVCEAHADVVAVPLSNKDVLTPLREDMLKALEDQMFQGVSTGAKRKYYRAIQTALVSIGAARQVLFEGYKTINVLKKSNSATAKSDMQATMVNAQTDAYERVKYAFGQIKDALTLPSATHGMDAPGIGDTE